MTSKTVLILGGGVGGLAAATELRKALPPRHRVVLVERESSFVFAPSLLWLITGSRTAEQISRPMTRLEKHGVEVVRGEIERIEPGKREIVVSGRTLTGDYLIIALGAELATEAVPGRGKRVTTSTRSPAPRRCGMPLPGSPAGS